MKPNVTVSTVTLPDVLVGIHVVSRGVLVGPGVTVGDDEGGGGCSSSLTPMRTERTQPSRCDLESRESYRLLEVVHDLNPTSLAAALVGSGSRVLCPLVIRLQVGEATSHLVK